MSSIGSVGSSSTMMMQGMRPPKRPDPAEMAENLFAKLDTSGQGYIQKADLQAAFDGIATNSSNTTSATTSSSSSVDDLFSTFDADSDGKVTKDEFSSAMQKIAEELDNQFMNMRKQGGMQGMGEGMGGGMQGMGGMPPPPPPGGGNDAGFTKDELSSQLSEIGDTDSKRASLISDVVNNFDKADTDGDGKVTFKEAMAYEQSSKTSASATSASTSSGSAGSANDVASADNAKLMHQIMRLIHAYGIGSDTAAGSAAGSSISVLA